MWSHLTESLSRLSCSRPAISSIIGVSPMAQQKRNTYILRRRYAPLLHKKGHRHQRLRTRHYVYDLVEDTCTRRKENLDVILITHVPGLGESGDRISVKPQYAHHQLLLPKLAVYASPENIEKYCVEKTEENAVRKFSTPTAERAVNILSQRVLSVVMNKETPWVIEPWHIRMSFRKGGIVVPEDAIVMPQQRIEGPNLDLEGKEFKIEVLVNNRDRAIVRCCIHHWSTKIEDRLPYEHEFWLKPQGSVFPEEQSNQ